MDIQKKEELPQSNPPESGLGEVELESDSEVQSRVHYPIQ